MRTKTAALLAAMVAISAGSALAQTGGIVTREIRYEAGGQDLVGYLATRQGFEGTRPAVIVVHEWTGINAYARKRAEDLAKEGYVAFALDMYGDGKEVPVSQARNMSGQVGSNFPLIRERFGAALDVLKVQSGVDASRIAAIGYCFGGGIVLNMARMGTDLAGVVSYHGSLNTGLTAGPGDIQTRVLALQGDGDPVAPKGTRDAFAQEMQSAGADFEFVVYPDLPAHNFTNPAGRSYYPEEAEDAWSRMLAFFEEIF